MNLAYPIKNTNRTVGAIISNEISKIYGHLGLPEDTLNINFAGSAGQSFGAFGAFGLTFILEGNTNDYLGKGLSGAKLIIKKPAKADFLAASLTISKQATRLFLNCFAKSKCLPLSDKDLLSQEITASTPIGVEEI